MMMMMMMKEKKKCSIRQVKYIIEKKYPAGLSVIEIAMVIQITCRGNFIQNSAHMKIKMQPFDFQSFNISFNMTSQSVLWKAFGCNY